MGNGDMFDDGWGEKTGNKRDAVGNVMLSKLYLRVVSCALYFTSLFYHSFGHSSRAIARKRAVSAKSGKFFSPNP